MVFTFILVVIQVDFVRFNQVISIYLGVHFELFQFLVYLLAVVNEVGQFKWSDPLLFEWDRGLLNLRNCQKAFLESESLCLVQFPLLKVYLLL